MTSDQKLANVERQIRAAMGGRQNVITCPYCRGKNVRENEALCCETFAKAVAAVNQRIESQVLIDHAARIADSHHLN